jgi:hypothetical protein
MVFDKYLAQQTSEKYSKLIWPEAPQFSWQKKAITARPVSIVCYQNISK